MNQLPSILAPDAWHLLHASTLLELLTRAFEGEDPELLYIELYARSHTDAHDA